MNITVDKNNRGVLEISHEAFDKILKSSVANTLSIKTVEIAITSKIINNNHLYILIKLMFQKSTKMLDNLHEQKIIAQIDKLVLQILNIKPKNIAVAYLHQ